MHCREIMSTNLEWVSDQATIQQVAAKMSDSGVGFLPICDHEGRPIGVVTDRDLTTRALARSLPTETTRITQIMSTPVITCLADAELPVAEDLMARERKQRLICTDLNGRLVGTLSLVDLVQHAPENEAIETARAVMSREALGPRGGAALGTPLLKDDPLAHDAQIETEAKVHDTAVTGGHWRGSMKEFPS